MCFTVIYQRIKNPIRFLTLIDRKKEKIDTYSKNSFYRIIRLYSKKQRWNFKKFKCKNLWNTKEKLMYYDLTQQLLILKHFLVKVIKNRYSKDGKFKEDQIVIGGNWWKWIPLHYKIFQKVRSNTFIPFSWNADIYEVNRNYNATKEEVNRNIRF